MFEELKTKLGALTRRGKIREIDVLKSVYALLSAGISVQDAMTSIADKIRDASMSEKLNTASDLVSRGGRTFSEALSEVGLLEKYTELLNIGQKTGNLREIIKEIIDIEKQMYDVRRAVKKSITYPIIVAAASILIGFGMSFMLQKIVGALKFPGVDKTFAYQMGMFIVRWKVLLFSGWTMFLAGAGYWIAKNVDKVPGVSGIYNSLALGQAFRTSGLAIASGLSPSQAFAMAASVVKGKWREIMEMMSAESLVRNVSEVFDEVEEYMSVENFLVIKVKLESGSMSEGFSTAGTNLLQSAMDKLGGLGSIVSVAATILVAAQIIVIMSPIYMIIMTFMDRVTGKF
ncbi:MAG TPA: type II secretion system F family protein [Syntrophorhabdaceae bacterium]|nr:type II secretion system F family protein [Syntrophorhabdaceae bacterium]